MNLEITSNDILNRFKLFKLSEFSKNNSAKITALVEEFDCGNIDMNQKLQGKLNSSSESCHIVIDSTLNNIAAFFCLEPFSLVAKIDCGQKIKYAFYPSIKIDLFATNKIYHNGKVVTDPTTTDYTSISGLIFDMAIALIVEFQKFMDFDYIVLSSIKDKVSFYKRAFFSVAEEYKNNNFTVITNHSIDNYYESECILMYYSL